MTIIEMVETKPRRFEATFVVDRRQWRHTYWYVGAVGMTWGLVALTLLLTDFR